MDSQEQYKKEKLTIDISRANVIGVILAIPVVVVFGIPFLLIWKDTISTHFFDDFRGSSTTMVISLVVLIAGIVAHEGIHGITWAAFAKKGFKSISFGIMWKTLTPYCHCDEPMKVSQYVWGAIMPAILLGIIPSIVSLFTGIEGMCVFGTFFTIAACGDFIIIYLLRHEKADTLVEDHPSEAGCYVYRRIQP